MTFRSSPRRVAAALALIGAFATGLGATTGADAAPAGYVVDGRTDDWRGRSSMVAGSVQIDRGELIYQDYLFDDTGARTTGQRPSQKGTFDGRTTGTYRYPTDTDRFADNAADLVDLRLATRPGEVVGLIRLGALRATDTTIATLAVDTDGQTAGDPGVWPDDAGLATPGADVAISVWGTGGHVVDLASGATTPIAVATSTDDNAIEFAVPRGALPGRTWTLWAGTGLFDGDGYAAVPAGAPTTTTPGYGDPALPRLFNVAFRASDSGAFYEDEQSAALTTGDISRYSIRVDVTTLDRRRTQRFTPPAGRFLEVIVDTGFTIGPLHEGQSFSGGVQGRFAGAGGVALDQHFDYFGRLQPYTLRLPSDWRPDRPWPLLMSLHGLGGSHSGFIAQPSFTAQVLEAPGVDSLVLAAPLGRGSSFYTDYGEADVLAVLRDVERRVAIDTDRRYLAGYSMGGYGTYRLATTHPDLWAAAATWAGYTGEFVGAYQPNTNALLGDPTGLGAATRESTGVGNGAAGQAATGNPLGLLGNLREVPLLHAAGSNDEIVPTSGQLRSAQVFDGLDLRWQFKLYPGFEHLSFALLDDWAGVRAWFGDRRRVVTPRVVDHRFSPAYNDPNLDVDLGLRYDRAYWVSGLVRRDAPTDEATDVFTYGRIVAESLAIPADDHTVVPVRTVSTEIHPHVVIGDDWGPGPPLPVANELRLDLANLRAGTVDLRAARLSTRDLLVRITSDGPATIVLLGDTKGLRVVATAGATVRATGGRITVTVPAAGTYTVTSG